MQFLRRGLTGLFLLALTLGLLAYAANAVRGAVQARMGAEAPSFGQRERVASVNVVTVQAQTLTPELAAFGEVQSRRTLVLRSPVAGTIIFADPAFVEGGSVSAGQLLVQLDPTDAQSALTRAQVDLRDAEAEVRDATRALEIARDSLAESESQAALRQAALERTRGLRDRGTATALDLETAELAAASANASVLSQRNAVAQAEARRDQSGTALDRVRLTVSEAERTLEDTDIRAPFGGTLSGVTLFAGGRVSGNEQIAELIDPAALEVAFRVSTAQYGRLLDERSQLRTQPVKITLDVSGFVLTTDGQITRESALVGDGQTGRLLYASVNAAQGLRPGDFVSVTIEEPELTGVAMLPATAVGADGAVLALDSDSRLEIVPVTVLRRQGDDVIVEAAGIEGRQIVETRTPLLGAGIRVQAAGQAAPTAAAGPGATAPAGEDIELDEDRRAKLVAFVTQSGMPAEAKARILEQLKQPKVPAETVARIESRMGG